MPDQAYTITVSPNDKGKRLDAFLAKHLPELTRSRIKKLIQDGAVLVDGKSAKPASKVSSGQTVRIEIPEPQSLDVEAQEIPLDILYEDSDIVVVNKPAGLVVHPAPGNPDNTLVNALLHHCDDLSGIGGVQRPGIVHRLDKGTSGVLIVAKNDAAHLGLTEAFSNRLLKKQYIAVTLGIPKEKHGTWDEAIGRHPTQRKKMSVISNVSKPAVTHYSVLGYEGGVGALRLHIETGRTHQIRVHCSAHHCPVAYDELYSGIKGIKGIHDPELRTMLQKLTRPALHAWKLDLAHPITGRKMEFQADPPEDITGILDKLGVSLDA